MSNELFTSFVFWSSFCRYLRLIRSTDNHNPISINYTHDVAPNTHPLTSLPPRPIALNHCVPGPQLTFPIHPSHQCTYFTQILPHQTPNLPPNLLQHLSCPAGPKGDSAYYTLICYDLYNYSCSNGQLTLEINYPAPISGRAIDRDGVCSTCTCSGPVLGDQPQVSSITSAPASTTTSAQSRKVSIVSVRYDEFEIGS